MSDGLRYRIVDEPRAGRLQRFALPPLLVFLAGNFFLPWGWLLVAVNAVTLNGPHRNREIAFSAIAITIYFGTLAVLNTLVRQDVLAVSRASYLFVAAMGICLVFAAIAYVSQARTAQLRQYLRQSQ